jgi:hypothetical protein
MSHQFFNGLLRLLFNPPLFGRIHFSPLSSLQN